MLSRCDLSSSSRRLSRSSRSVGALGSANRFAGIDSVRPSASFTGTAAASEAFLALPRPLSRLAVPLKQMGDPFNETANSFGFGTRVAIRCNGVAVLNLGVMKGRPEGWAELAGVCIPILPRLLAVRGVCFESVTEKLLLAACY